MAKILHQFVIEAPAEKVFEAFCTPQGLDSWWTLQSAGKPEMGRWGQLLAGLKNYVETGAIVPFEKRN